MKIQIKRGSSNKWKELNPILSLGEPGYDKDAKKLKIGDGQTAWQDLLPIDGNNDLKPGSFNKATIVSGGGKLTANSWCQVAEFKSNIAATIHFYTSNHHGVFSLVGTKIQQLDYSSNEELTIRIVNNENNNYILEVYGKRAENINMVVIGATPLENNIPQIIVYNHKTLTVNTNSQAIAITSYIFKKELFYLRTTEDNQLGIYYSNGTSPILTINSIGKITKGG